MNPSVPGITMRSVSNFLLTVYLTVIGAISLYDMVLTVRYSETLKQLELNPIGRWLMQLDQIPKDSLPDLTFFLAAKGLGTVIVLLVIFLMTQRRARLGHPVGAGVSLCQIVLAMYLCYGTVE
jgi:hypothetical protein